MVAAIALTAGLVLVTGGSHTPRTETVAIELAPTSSTSVVTETTLSGDSAAPDINEILGAVVDDHVMTHDTTATTTTTLPAPTTTRPAASGPTTTRPRPTTTQPAPTTTTISGEFRSDFEAEFLSHLNALRASHGLAPLTRDGSLDSRARDWSRRMADNGKLSHSNIANLLPPWSAAGENVGRGGSVSSLFNALANSPNHLSNMLADFTHVGIGVWRAGDGTVWTTHVFTR